MKQDTMRSTYRELSEYEKAAIEEIKGIAERLYNRLDNEMQRNLTSGSTAGYRQLLKAKDRLEESVMWAVKGLTG